MTEVAPTNENCSVTNEILANEFSVKFQRELLQKTARRLQLCGITLINQLDVPEHVIITDFIPSLPGPVPECLDSRIIELENESHRIGLGAGFSLEFCRVARGKMYVDAVIEELVTGIIKSAIEDNDKLPDDHELKNKVCNLFIKPSYDVQTEVVRFYMTFFCGRIPNNTKDNDNNTTTQEE